MKRLLSILFLLLPFALHAQQSTVVLKGKVVDAADGYPLIGVAVFVQDTKSGTMTDVDGTYELTIPQSKCEVTFSYMGYDDEVRLYTTKNASSFVRIVMSMNAEQLADVVVTGVYERKKESFTGASATFKTDELKGFFYQRPTE